jgi:uncharacterized protein YajQ (UPF0234 family)
MAATKADDLFQKILALIKEAQLIDCSNHGLDDEEGQVLECAHDLISEVWSNYLDRMIAAASLVHPDPEAAVALAGEDPAELELAKERVRAKLIQRGVPLVSTPTTKKQWH